MKRDADSERSDMFIPTVIMAVLAGGALFFTYFLGGKHLESLRLSFKMLWEILPLLVFAFILAGAVQIIIPHQLIAGWIGKSSGFKGILIGTISGALCPGGPYVSLPLAAGFLQAGAGIPTMVAFITSWSLWAVGRIPMEVGILGWKFTLIRLASTFLFPPLAGLIAQLYISFK